MTFCLLSPLIIRCAPIPCSFFDLRGDSKSRSFREPLPKDLPIDDQSYIIAATRGHQHDEIVVEQAIKTPARYVGMLGSERKKLILWKRIAERGGLEERLDEVFAPIGVNIGADTPEEIAVSVVAELIEVRRGPQRKWKTKKDRVNEQV